MLHIRYTINTKKLALRIAVIFSMVCVPTAVYAATNTADTIINANIASTISLLNTGTVNLPVTPVSGGAQTTASDTVLVSTNNTSGYTLSLKDSDATTALTKDSDTIPASSNTYASPAVLANNTWGYRVDDSAIGGFGAGPTTASTDQTTNAALFSGIHTTDDTIKSTTTTTAGDTIYVWYSVKADTSNPNGTYTDTVTYTATTNP